jgi:hypothetical protein
METKLTISSLWSFRVLSAGALALLLALGSLSPSFAEEEASEPAAEESAPEAEPTPEPEATPEPTPEPEPEYVPPPEALEGLGGWAVVDPDTGRVHGVIVGNFTSMDQWDSAKSRMENSLNGYMGCPAPCVLRFQTRATADGNVAGWHGPDVRWDASSRTFRMGNQSGDTQTSQTLVPERTSRNSDGTGRSMDLHTGLVDIQTTTTKRSGDVSATLRTQRDSYLDSTLRASLSLPDLGENGSLLTYEATARSDADSERPGALDRISLDVDSLLMENGYVITETTIDEETGEETATEVIDSSSGFVVAIRDVTRAVVDFFSSLLGFGEPRE